MEILINGQVFNEPKVSKSDTFAKTMAELNRLLGMREEIITDVVVDGRDIPGWDSAELDMSDVARLEIQSQPAREYAISSLGDLGDYTAEVLSVLRNVEKISQKQGFDAVRQKLVEGLDYILIVIEIAGKILHLKLDESRYDMRSGAQMLNEVRSLRTRISNASDISSARRNFEDLEFTLTDWLKFLEMLLLRYGDQQAEIGSADDISTEANQHVEALNRLQADVKSIIEDLYTGKVAKSLDQFQTRILTLQESLSYLQRLRDGGRINYQTLCAEGESMTDKIPHVAKILKELSDAIQVGDTVLLRDLLEYELLPFILYLGQIFGQMSALPKKE